MIKNEDVIFKKLTGDEKKKIDLMAPSMALAVGLVARLRGNEGCPWDREQTHLTLRPYLIEEAYEVLDVLDQELIDQNKLKEELGDLLLQILLHSRLSEEEGSFHFGDVCSSMVEKLVSRHPHVFGDTKVKGSDEVLKNWESLKKKEGKKRLLEGLPKNLPSLQRAARIGEKANRIGFDWKDWKGSMSKVDEELSELKESINQSIDQDGKVNSNQHIEEELGDLFFSLCNLARFLKITPEDAHRKAISKFEKRFSKIEDHFENIGKDIHTATLEELDEVWEKIKKQF